MQQIQVQVKGFTKIFKGITREIITECGVSLPFAPSPGLKQPPVIETKGLWDTGATGSVITKDLALKLGLKAVRTVESHHAGGSSTVNVYLINIFLPNQVCIPFVEVSECIDTIGRFGILIGMDVFSKGDFALSHQAGDTIVSFRMPSIQAIRLEKDGLPNQNVIPKSNVQNKTQGRNELCNCGSGKKFKHCHGK